MVVLGEVAPGKRLVILGIQVEFHGCMFFLVGSFNESLFFVEAQEGQTSSQKQTWEKAIR